ncbi:serine hydrolase [Heyndrickxia vini]|uniref:Serine hydrolase n=1 Tax=Heyndrickxia vini TaxID=1476025 RepID=A0ABX7E6P0_9BACI|nr:serine hydrolase [Heyndrickxia vini]QQZ09997.1 serine hydrolase [Heyndrickxia vini]
MRTTKKAFITLILLFLLFSIKGPDTQATTIETSYQTFTKNLSHELKQYIKKSGGDITLEYQDLTTGETFAINSKKSHRAASTIKLPLALYVMELADAKKINLNEKLTYKRYHYYGGSGVIQNDKIGTKYKIKDLVKKAMIYSDNIAFIMLKEKVGQANFIKYIKKLGGTYAYPKGENKTSSHDLAIYAKHLYDYAQTSKNGKELLNYLQHTIYNETIPKGIKGVKIAHKVGMIPDSKVSNDVGVIYDKNPFVLAIMTNKLSYEKSKTVISKLAAIVYKHHKVKNDVAYFKTKTDVSVYKSTDKKKKIGQLKKNETFAVITNEGPWLAIQFGTSKGYIQKKSVTSYAKAPITGFSKPSEIYQVKLLKTAPVLKTASSKGKVLATINKDIQLQATSMSNDYYKVTVGNRSAFIHQKNVSLQFTKAITYIQINKEGTPIYTTTSNDKQKIGTLKKGIIFPRIKEVGGYSELQLGTTKVYVLKSATTPIYQATIRKPKNQTAGTIKLIESTTINEDPSRQQTLGTIDKDQSISYIETIQDWYVINYLGRIGYIPMDAAENPDAKTENES